MKGADGSQSSLRLPGENVITATDLDVREH